MQSQIKPDFDRFLMAVLNGEEFEIYSVQRDELLAEPPSQGEHDMVIETKKRLLRYTIYVSHGLEVIFFSGGPYRTQGRTEGKRCKKH